MEEKKVQINIQNMKDGRTNTQKGKKIKGSRLKMRNKVVFIDPDC